MNADVRGLTTALQQLEGALKELTLPLEAPGVGQQRTARAEMLDQLSDYVLPRLDRLDAPLLAVVGGSTGAGKSTLVNSVIGRPVSQPGVLRPTTRAPVLVANPADRDWFDGDRILPDLARSSTPSLDAGVLQVVLDDALPAGLAVMDAPDIDSVESGNRLLATQLLAAADLWLFVTSAARYADQVPWDFLRAAAERSAAVAVVLDRTPPHAVDEVSAHLRQMMTERGLGGSELFTIAERVVDGQGLLPAADVAPVRDWLQGLAADSEARARVVRQTLDGAIDALTRRTDELAEAHTGQVQLLDRLRGEVDQSYDRAEREVSAASADGSLLRGELLARWQEFVGTGELLRSLETRVGRVRDRAASWMRGRPAPAQQVNVAVESGLEALLVEHAEAAAERAWQDWHGTDAGRLLLETSPGSAGTSAGADLGRASRSFRDGAARMVRDWQQGVLELVREEGADRRKTARFLAFGLNGLSVALMVVVFVHTAGLTGAEAGIAGGSAVLGQKLLEAVFGDQAVRRLTELARADLDRRVAELFSGERERWSARLDELALDPDAGERLAQAGRFVVSARRAG